MAMTVTDAAAVNTLLAWLLAHREEGRPMATVHDARVAAVRLAGQAHQTLGAGLSGPRVAEAWETVAAAVAAPDLAQAAHRNPLASALEAMASGWLLAALLVPGHGLDIDNVHVPTDPDGVVTGALHVRVLGAWFELTPTLLPADYQPGPTPAGGVNASPAMDGHDDPGARLTAPGPSRTSAAGGNHNEGGPADG